ncbi:rab effector Noc2 isoform X1 [Onychostruthus taczanowskii]|uniref:rab effector Noc2 isoform X1 n=1 Tax=Onychostruthus taczanowskii TaxID=356909 RepID=UPI001B80169B|nr:rab effector Noc2 isoform X1 [Onychostruthus taczanowskii]XP_041279053.1 rab effector Noc2 isoform X1 [Onychostruthus taczanowskii]
MAEMIFGSGMGPWVCPNDRQLALRAKLQTGWSVHTFQTEKQRKMQALSPKELEVILGVIRKAEQLDVVEQQRVGRLVERLENMRKNAMGNGLSQCLLCGEMLGLLGSSSVFCQDCKKKVCTKCGIEAVGAQKRPLWLCKICSEQREVWKRSGAWFYRGLPKYITPLKSSSRALELQGQPWQGEAAEPESVGSSRSFTWARGKVVSSDSESDSELSSSSLDDKPVGSKGSQGRKLQAGMAPTRGPSQARGTALGTPPCPQVWGSHSSLGSEQGAELSPTESGRSDRASGRRHSDASTPGMSGCSCWEEFALGLLVP